MDPSSPVPAPADEYGPVASEIEAGDHAEIYSAYAESTTETTESLRSSIADYTYKHGRRYHGFHDVEYWGPNDDKQQNAEDLGHEMYRTILGGKLYLAPIPENVQNVLDVGCGTGIWAIDFADANPSAKVIGVDISPIQPAFVPPNCEFQVDDINEDWTFPENQFDFVHLRHMTGCVSDWAAFHKNAFRYVKPGGWVEQVELSGIATSDDGTLKEDSVFKRWWEVFREVGEKVGKAFDASEVAHESIEAAGYVNVKEHSYKTPIGPWAKDENHRLWGRWNRAYLLEGLEGFALKGLTDVLRWRYDDAQQFLAEVRKELRNPDVHSYIYLRVVYGQKPPST
ncbi:S-adenosyl-L-methionine-dependent methyltransferase [Phialemonium atrogriseum]|uniref:S-adenosyl-L-methionine-dependent methyltransferase n=1 Tax=Phialemonium atrogriseum TaxID=1093897 RepID=A0AAJ0BWY1_9PEZI|nr:S-adenosyl-L-methionine-dependent methyltransferase [Phialemonium atrogriseum]KAK1765999.1 S-adenosyl-L-methionine-dependent methyltransferase [Phialemonium atrogriseum]